MSHLEEYIVDNAAELVPGMLELLVHPRPGSTAPTPVGRILLLNGATSATSRTGIEIGLGATINLQDSDYLDAHESIGSGDIVSYLSDAIPSRRPPPRASIQNFNFPMDYP